MNRRLVTYNKGFHKCLGQEDMLAASLTNWLTVQHPELVWWHTNNEGRKTPFERYKALVCGTTAGVSDFICPVPRKDFGGLAIELKVVYANGKKNTLTTEQKEFLQDMKRIGWCTAVCYDFEEAEAVISWYLDSQGNRSVVPQLAQKPLLWEK